MKYVKILAAIAIAASAVQAQAAVLKFTYQATTGLLAGSLTGTLLGDNNSFNVTSAAATFTYTGGSPAGIALGFVGPGDFFAGGTGQPFVTIDGSAQSLIACNTSACNLGFLFAAPTSFVGSPLFNSSTVYGGVFELYNQANWNASVPEAASWAMLIAGFGLTGAAMRRRRMAVAA